MSDPDYAAAYLAKAARTLASARNMLAIGDAEGACNRAYYAMFNAAHAALYGAGFGEQTAAIKTHSGLLSFFGQKMVGTERLAGEYGRAINRTGRLRSSADYMLDPPSLSEATWAVRAAEELIEAVRTMAPS
ncbi:HEPN domain-containing protein [Lichenibacterium dinghuense]|uniref:HEPN domain-containing protein n=1 Tax=Lichenibacterium dinghuense TaxID=2895977 RepID=UPI001F3658B7|nr:HEPN domain-containing protein [Lichenibacterium sp. 6Y81]